MKRVLQASTFQGISPAQLRALLALRNEDVNQVARAIGEEDRRISETLTRGRINERVRIKLCLYLNMQYRAVWGGEPNWKEVAAELRDEYDARFNAAGSGVAA